MSYKFFLTNLYPTLYPICIPILRVIRVRARFTASNLTPISTTPVARILSYRLPSLGSRFTTDDVVR